MKKNELLHDAVSEMVMDLEQMNFDENPGAYA